MNHSPIHKESKPKAAKANSPFFSSVVQKKMSVGAENDSYEAEADTIADRILLMQEVNNRSFSHTDSHLQKKCISCEEENLRKKPLADRITPLIQSSSLLNKSENQVPAHVENQINTTRGSGNPLDRRTREFMEERFGVDFSGVRTYTNSQAAQMSQALNAQAFTVGNNIYFNQNQYNPDSNSGKHLLAHELTHTVQQSGSTVKRLQKKASGESLVQRNVFGDIGRGIGSAASTAWDHTGGAVIRFGGRVIEWVEDRAEEIINEIAPGLLRFLRSSIWEPIRDMIARGLDTMTGGLFTRLQEEGLSGILHEFVDNIILTLQGNIADACRSFAQLAEKIFNFISSLSSGALARLRATFTRISGFFSGIWNNYGKPAIDAIRHYARAAWDWIVEKAQWLWDLIAPIRNAIQRAWNWIKRMFNIAWEGVTSARDWLVEKASQAWNWIKQAIEPVKVPLMVIGSILLLLSPLGIFVAIGAAVYGIYMAVQWVRANWNNEVFVRFRNYLQQNIFEPIRSGIQQLQNLVNSALQWLSSKFQQLQAAFQSLVNAVTQSSIFVFLRGIVRSVSNMIRSVTVWISTQATRVGRFIADVAQRVWTFIRPAVILIAKLIVLAANPWLIPIVIMAWYWRIMPDCYKPPIINFVLRVMIGVLGAMPNFALFGQTWVQVKTRIIQYLQQTLETSNEEKIAVANRVARMVSEMDLSLLSNQIAAASGAPGEFEGQMEEELLGVNLAVALPFERTSFEVPSLHSQFQSSGLGDRVHPADAALFSRTEFTNQHIDVDSVGEFAPGIDLQQAILSRTGTDEGTVEFGNSDDRSRTVHSILSEMLPSGGGASTGAEGETATGDASAHAPMTHEEETEMRLQQMMAQSNEEMARQACTPPAREGSSVEGSASAFPEEAKFGPLTRSQRGRYTMNQMSTGMGHWWRCNRNWLIPTIIGVIIVIVLAEILSGGAVTAALPAIFSALVPIMIGVAAIRATYYLGEYVYKSISGDIPGASRALARAFAVAAVETIFALLGSSAFWKSLKGGISGAGKVAGRTSGAIVRGTGRLIAGTGRLGRGVVGAVGAGSRYVLRTAGAVITRGKLIIQGVRGRMGQGVRTLEELAERLFSRVRFRRFRIRFARGWFRLEGYINPWVLLATGSIQEIDDATLEAARGGSRSVLGAEVRIGGQRGVIIGAEENASNLTRYLENNARIGGNALDENRELFEAIASGRLRGSTAIYSRAIDNVISHSSTAQRLIENGLPINRVQSIIENAFTHGGTEVSTLLNNLERVQRFNFETFDRLISELSHPGRNKFSGANFLLEFLGSQSNEFIAGVRGFEIIQGSRRIDMIIINGLEFEFKNWGDLRNVGSLATQMQNDFRAGVGLMNSRYVISIRAGSTSSLISSISTAINSTFTNATDAQLAIRQLENIILRF